MCVYVCVYIYIFIYLYICLYIYICLFIIYYILLNYCAVPFWEGDSFFYLQTYFFWSCSMARNADKNSAANYL